MTRENSITRARKSYLTDIDTKQIVLLIQILKIRGF